MPWLESVGAVTAIVVFGTCALVAAGAGVAMVVRWIARRRAERAEFEKLAEIAQDVKRRMVELHQDDLWRG